jgi:hypothetical protein
LKTNLTWRLGYFCLGVLSCLLAVSLALIWSRPSLQALARGGPETWYTGPWGELQATPVQLANPNGELPDQAARLQKPSWFFERHTETDVVRLLSECRLRPVQRKILFDRQFWQVTSNGCLLTPPEPVIWSLSPRARGLIYRALARSPANYAQCFPFRFLPEKFEDQLRETGLTAAEIQMVKRLAYTNNNAVCFTDLKILHDRLKPEAFEELVGALYKVPAYTLRLRVNPEADLAGIIRYWGAGGREKAVSPILKGLARVPGGGTVNVAQLLPPFPRARLYTFPDSWNDPDAAREDCFYAAMNFFAEAPDTNFFNGDHTRRVLAEEFDKVSDTATFGDRLLVVNARGQGVHMCVYVAGDFVFTKNGINRAEPWVLMRLADVLSIYLGPDHDGHLSIYRPRSRPVPPGV